MVTMANRIRELREARGLSQAALGRLMGTDHSSVSRWETGRSKPYGGTAVRLARVLGVQVEDLALMDPGALDPLGGGRVALRANPNAA